MGFISLNNYHNTVDSKYSEVDIYSKFSNTTDIYKKVITVLETTWNDKHIKYYDDWFETVSHFYEVVDKQLLFRHTYLILVSNRFFEMMIDKIVIDKILNDKISLLNNEIYFIQWIIDEDVYATIIAEIDKVLYFFADKIAMKTDLFIQLYENIISDRHENGEYYTPYWLSKYIVEQLSMGDKYLDPSCGSGTFLIAVMHHLINKKNIHHHQIFDHITGYEINPVSAYIARINLLLNLSVYGEIRLQTNPIELRDTTFVDGSEKYDRLIGNPPWVVLRNIKDTQRREHIKRLAMNYRLLSSDEIHLYTQLETAAVFFNISADMLLGDNGKIAYILPKSVLLGTKHLNRFREFNNPEMKVDRIMDLSGISSLFPMPACVIYADKSGKSQFPVHMLDIKNTSKIIDSYETFISDSQFISSKYSPPMMNREPSWYYDKVKVGACIFPKSLYFITIKNADGEYVDVTTDPDLRVSKKWDLSLEGRISNKYLYKTLETVNLYPFYISRFTVVALPILIDDKIKISEKMDKHSREWFNRVEEVFIDINSRNNHSNRIKTVYDRLNYNNDLLNQKLNSKYLVVSNATGKNIKSSVINRYDDGFLDTPFISDVKFWRYDTDNEEEAYYLASILNSSYLNKKIKVFQPNGKGGARAIHRIPFQFPVPKFDMENKLHRELAEIGIDASIMMRGTFNAKPNRRIVTDALKEYIIRIDRLVAMLF